MTSRSKHGRLDVRRNSCVRACVAQHDTVARDDALRLDQPAIMIRLRDQERSHRAPARLGAWA